MGEHEDMFPLEVLRAVNDAAVDGEVRPAVAVCMRERVMRENRVALRKSLLDFGLQRFIGVARVVPIIVEALRPAEFPVIGLACIGAERGETNQRRLIQVVVWAVAVKVVGSFVRHVTNFSREVVGKGVLDCDVPGVHRGHALHRRVDVR